MALLTTILMALSPLLQPADAVPKPPEPVVSSPSPGRAEPTPVPVRPGLVPAPPGTQALASWYGERPVTCDGAPVPWWVEAWTANLTLPCGSLVRLSGPAGTITVPVFDRGPEAWTGRAFDLSPAAFEAVAGKLSEGVVPVSWRPAA